MELNDNNTEVTFSDLVEFVRRQSRLMNQPLFGNISDGARSSISRSVHKPTMTNTRIMTTKLASESTRDNATVSRCSSGKSCSYCHKTNHDISYCFFFKKIPYDDKMKFFDENKLCYGCTRHGHRTRGCSQKLACQICQRKHPSILHNDNFTRRTFADTNQRASNETITENENDANICLSTVVGGKPGARSTAPNKILCSVLPVEIKVVGRTESVRTYAALDTCSDGCFVDDELLPQLGVKNDSTASMNIRVMRNANSNVSTTVLNNVQLFDLDSNLRDTVPVVYALSNWPFSESDVPREADINTPHLIDIPFRFIDSNIGMIIGMNRSEMMKPLKIIDGPKNAAYASLHKLDWALNGPVRRNTEDPVSVH